VLASIKMALLTEGGGSFRVGVYKDGPPDGGAAVVAFGIYKDGPPDGRRRIGSVLASIKMALLTEGSGSVSCWRL